MTRVNEAIMAAGQAYAQGVNAPAVDLRFGGQNGYSTEHGEYVSSAAYVRKPLIPILIEAPKAMQYLPNPDKWVATLRALIELHPQSIDGLNATLTVDMSSNPFGGSGLIQQDILNVKETPSAPVFHYVEKYGRSISRFLRAYITYLGMDPTTKFANLATLASAAGATDLLPDQYACTVLFIEPDPLMRKVVQSWLVTNMFPMGTGDIVGSMDKTQDGATTNIEVPWSGIHQYGVGVDAFAQKVLSGMSIIGANPNLRQAFIQSIAPDIRSDMKGFASGVQSAANNIIAV